MPPLPESVLVVRLGAIGDVTNALVFAEALREHAPRTRIGWVVHPLALPLVEGHPALDRVHLWRRERALRALPSLVRELRAERYELVVDLQRIAKSALLARLCGAPRSLGYDRGRSKEGSWLLHRERIPAGDPHAHMVEQYLEFARHLGIPDPGVRHRFPPDPRAEAWAEARVAEWGGAPIVLAIGASKPKNRWPAERFGRLARSLAPAGWPLVLAGGPGDREAGGLALAQAGEEVHDLVGRTDLHQLIALLGRARLVVSADSGPMHLAAAQERPVVALFGPADPRRTGPWEKDGGCGHRVIHGGNGDSTMDSIPVEEVERAVLDLLDRKPRSGTPPPPY